MMLSDNQARSELDSHLRLVRFTWDKETEPVAIEFVPGFNLLSELNQIDRTLILRLIRYSMGGSHSRIDTTTMQTTKRVTLEFLANGRLVHSSRGFEHPDGQFQIKIEEQPVRSLDPREMATLLLDLLGIPKVHYQRGDAKPVLSFNDLARTFVVDRDFSYTRILAEMYPEERRESVKMMLGLTTQEIADTEEESRDTEARSNRLEEEIRGIERMLAEFDVGSSTDIEDRRRNLHGLLNELGKREDNLRRKIREVASLGSHSAGYQAREYDRVRKELVTKRITLDELTNELATLNRQIEEKRDLKLLLDSEVQKLERLAASQYVMSTFAFSRCPRCLQSIGNQMRAREQENRCMLCDRPLNTVSEVDPDTWSKTLRDAKKSVEEAGELLSYYSTRLTSLESERVRNAERIVWLENRLAEQTAKYVSPLVEDLSLINEERNQVFGALSELAQEEKQRQYADRIRDVQLPALKTRLHELQDKLRGLRTTRDRAGSRVDALLTHFRLFMRATASSHFQSASWDESQWLPRINDQDHTKALTAYDLVICVLAFHYALLALKVEPPKFDTPHPGLLIIDEPEQQKMRPVQFEAVMKQLADLATKHAKKVQIIVAATTRTGFEEYLRPIATGQD